MKWLLVGLAAAVALAAAALAALPSLVGTPRVQALIVQSVAHALGRPVTVSSVSVSVLPLPAVVLRGLEIAEDPAFGAAPFLRLDEAKVRLRLWPLVFLRVQLGDFVLKKPVISLVRAADGRWNVASLGAAAEPRAAGRGRPGGGTGVTAVLGSRVRITDGLIAYEARAGGGGARYRIEGLDLTLTPGPGPLAFQGGATITPGDLAVKVTEGTVGLGGARSLAEAPVRAKVALAGRSVRDLVALAAGPEPVIAGGVRGTLTVGGTLGEPRARGEVTLSNLAVTQTNARCAEPTRRTLALGDLQASAVWEGGRLAGRPLRTGLGGGSVTANLAVTLDRSPWVDLGDLTIKAVPLDKVLVDFLCQGYAVTGPLDLSGQAAARLDDLWRTLDGRGQLRIGPGQVVGAQARGLIGGVVGVGGAVSALLSADRPASRFSSPLDFDSITASYQITQGVVTIRDLRYVSRAMQVAAAGTYALVTGAMHLDVVVSHGRGEVKARVTGTAASPSIRVVPSTILRNVDPGPIERGVQDLLKRFR